MQHSQGRRCGETAPYPHAYLALVERHFRYDIADEWPHDL